MIPIKYVTGDATDPQGTGRRIIAHVCNDVGVWGAGFVLALSARYFLPEGEYKRWRKTDGTLPPELGGVPFKLGQIQFVPFWDGTGPNPDVFVCNMIAQWGIRRPANVSSYPPFVPLQYDALAHCLRNLAAAANRAQATVHMPRIGCGLAGGKWEEVGPIVLKEVSSRNVEVTVYDLPQTHDAIEGSPGEFGVYASEL